MMKDAAPSARVLTLGERVPTMPIANDPIADEEAHAEKAAAGAAAKDDGDHDEKGAIDPHVWLHPRNAIAMTNTIASDLAAVDPLHAAGYFAKRYGLTIVAVIEPYPGSTPTAERVVYLDRGVKAWACGTS
jgi:ABC-type Zn uptake system ZnuABC Zn-binding protein ZnuA